MTDKITMEELVDAPTSDATVQTPDQIAQEEQDAQAQDPLKVELEKVTSGRTEAEKAEFTFKKQAERLESLGIDPKNVLGIKDPSVVVTNDEPSDDNAPVTVGMLKKMQQQTAEKSALQLADSITNATERELVKYHLENTIRSSGNPQQDFETAQSLVNAVKNKQILDTVVAKPAAVIASSNGGASSHVEQTPELSKEELLYTQKPFNMTPAEIIATRKK